MAGIRKRLPHLHDLTYDQVYELFGKYGREFYVTEKTDGMALAFGSDEKGFFTQTSNQEKAYSAHEYVARHHNSEWSQQMGAIHEAIMTDKAVMEYLSDYHTSHITVKGEIFWNGFVKKRDKHFITYNVIPYDVWFFHGYLGAFVAHTQLNDELALGLMEYVRHKDWDWLAWRLDHRELTKVQFRDDTAVEKVHEIVPSIIKDKKHSLHGLEKLKLETVKEMIQSHLDDVYRHIPMFGLYYEGLVFHPIDSDIKFKIVTEDWKRWAGK